VSSEGDRRREHEAIGVVVDRGEKEYAP